MKTTGELTEHERWKLQSIHAQALKIAETTMHRLAQTPVQQKDTHSNSWWRNYDKDLYREVIHLFYEYVRLIKGDMVATREDAEKLLDEAYRGG